MTRYFTLATDPMSAEEEKKFISKIPDGVGWWHWLPNYWLLKDPTETLEAKHLSDNIFEINQTVRCLALQVEPTSWSARSRKDSKGRLMADWLDSNWQRPPEI